MPENEAMSKPIAHGPCDGCGKDGPLLYEYKREGSSWRFCSFRCQAHWQRQMAAQPNIGMRLL